MVSSLQLFGLIAGVSIVLLLVSALPKRAQVGLVAASLFAFVLNSFSQPALANAVNDDVLSSGQKALKEKLSTTASGNQYQGIEYPQAKGTPLSDQQITEKIKAEVPNNLKLSVANGAVRLSGKVANREAAQEIVQDVKEIPGVHEVSYDLGLAS